MVVEKSVTCLAKMILPLSVESAFLEYVKCKKELDELAPIKQKCLDKAFREIRPVVAEFIIDGEHLSSFDQGVGSAIKDVQELIYANEHQQADFWRVYYDEQVKISPKNYGRICHYSKVEQLYRASSTKFLKLLEPISGVKVEQLSYSEKISYLSFLTDFLSDSFEVPK